MSRERNLDKEKYKTISSFLDMLYEEHENEVLEWIYNSWPHGFGLYD